MASKKLTRKQLREKRVLEDKLFRKYMRISLILLFIGIIVINVFFVFWTDTKYIFREWTFYGKEIPPKFICMAGNKLEFKESKPFNINGNSFYACSEGCKKSIKKNYNEKAFVADALSGDTICKADAVIGLKVRGSPDVVYFKNKQNFKNYYGAKTNK